MNHKTQKENYQTKEKAQSAERRAFDHVVVVSNLPTVPEVTMDGHSNSSFTISRCKIETGPWPWPEDHNE